MGLGSGDELLDLVDWGVGSAYFRDVGDSLVVSAGESVG